MLKDFIQKGMKSYAEKIYRHLGKDSGNMIITTGVAGILFSTTAQTIAIFLNKKYSVSQKAFMIPQELAEGSIAACSLVLMSRPIKSLGIRYAKTGKILTKKMKNYLEKQNLLHKRGEKDFDFSQSVKNIIDKIEASDKFVKSSLEEQRAMTKEHTDILHEFNIVKDSTSAITTTVGSMLSTAIITPLIRNTLASHYQPINVNLYNNIPQKYKDRHERIKAKIAPSSIYGPKTLNV